MLGKNGGELTEVVRVAVAGDADIAAARRAIRAVLRDAPGEVVSDAELVVSELVTNALLHGGGVADVTLGALVDGVRIEVRDANKRMPALSTPSTDAMTGRGFAMVQRLATRWGVEPIEDGKVVWAEVLHVEGAPSAHGDVDVDVEALLAGWGDQSPPVSQLRVRVSLGEVPTSLLVSAKRHVDNLVREFRLAAGGEESGTTAPVPAPLAKLIERVVNDFEDARLEIKRQATLAARAGELHTALVLNLPIGAADAAERYLEALDDVDAYSRANRLLTLETPPQHRVFRHWYIGEIVKQLRAAAAGRPIPQPMLFEDRLLAEVDEAEAARRSADRAARLYRVAGALAGAATAEAVASAVLTEGAAALGASGGGVLLAAADRIVVPATVGYGPEVVEKLRAESPDAELPAAFALRTGQAVWLETIEERNERFPALHGLEPRTTAMCAVPVVAGDRVLGALRFSFDDRRLFDEDEQRFVEALAAEAAEALDRAALLEREREARQASERERESLARLAAVGEAMLRGRDLSTILQLATDAATRICGAQFGAFFYNEVREDGEAYSLYTLSGAPRSAFENFPMPRNTAIFAPTFAGQATIRLDDVRADPRYGRNHPHYGLPEGHLPVRSYLAVPVALSTSEVVGGLFFGHEAVGQFSEFAEQLVVGVAGQAAAAIENVRSMQERQRVATTLQQSLLPAKLPMIDELEVGAHYAAAGSLVGGDFYDIFPLEPGQWGIAIGDVRGRGVAAAAMTSLARHTIRAAALLRQTPAEVCRVLNRLVVGEEDPEGFFSTLFGIVSVDKSGARFRYANAGHPPGYVVHSDALETLDPTGPLIGVAEASVFGEEEVALHEGDVLFLYTDGVSEARRGGEEFGDHRLQDALPMLRSHGATQIAEGIAAEATAFAGDSTPDDAATFVLKIR